MYAKGVVLTRARKTDNFLIKTLKDFIEYFGADRQCCVSRELTKVFEENKRGTLQQVHDYFDTKNVKGEIVIVVGGKE